MSKRFGNWHIDDGHLCIPVPNSGGFEYDFKLELARTPADAFGWIRTMSEKKWMTKADLGHLAEALLYVMDGAA